ncbi:glycosyltransferase [Arcticibacter sp. MXS-1]|uniref:glycosyltransferase n=1 Tax=Arcticibacter sp. MXS-1 TaxID=3341726 RepID=UPI0035A87DB7
MKILHITPDFNFASKFVKPVCLEQVNMGHRVVVISTVAFYLNHSSAPSLFSSFCRDSSKLRLELLDLRVRQFPLRIISSYFRYVKFLRKESFDLIIFHTTIDTMLPLVFAKFFARANTVYFNHGVPSLGYTGALKSLLALIEKLNIRLADNVFTIGPGMSGALKKIVPSASPEFVAPGSACGVKLLTSDFSALQQLREGVKERLGFSEYRGVVIYVGRPVKRKGLFDLIRSWRVVNDKKEYCLLLVGPSTDDFKEKDLGAWNIRAIGYVQDVRDYYLCADVLCVPSYHEGLGYTYLEAAAAGCVPISSNIPGPTDFIAEGVSGLTVIPGDINQIANSIRCLLENDTYRLTLSEGAFKKILCYDQNQIARGVAERLIAASFK